MEDSPSRPIHSDRSSRESTSRPSNMSMLAMATPTSHSAFSQSPWDRARYPDYSSPRPRPENDKVALPSIRQAFPELHLQLQNRDQYPKPPSTGTPTGTPNPGITSPEYVHSPNESKRRRLSIEDEQEGGRARQVPRLYYSPEKAPPSRNMSPSDPMRPGQEGQGYLPNGVAPPLAPVERLDARTSYPSLPPPRSLEREPAPNHHLPAANDAYQSSRAPLPPSRAGTLEAPAPNYREPSYPYPYHHPNRYQSLSTSSTHSFERAPFTSGSYGTPYQDFVRYGDMGPGGLGGDNKQRKRRGNLPKETTDKLRAWFVAHLQHPYPTEDEKQELMRQTGLQMNQISNWFINARRRQLPTMINNARAESDAMTSARSGGELKILATTERGDFDHHQHQHQHQHRPHPHSLQHPNPHQHQHQHHGQRDAAGPLSDGEGASYDEDLESLQHHRRTTNMSRGSV